MTQAEVNALVPTMAKISGRVVVELRPGHCVSRKPRWNADAGMFSVTNKHCQIHLRDAIAIAPGLYAFTR